jgi:hypothetical protein
MNRKSILLLFIAAVVIGIRFYTGVYIHDEFGSKHFFIKHRPIWKWTFYSPIGMSDKNINDLSDTEKLEQKLFDEFITKQGMSR